MEALSSEDKELVRIVPGQIREKVELQRLETFAKQNAGTIQGRIGASRRPVSNWSRDCATWAKSTPVIATGP